MESAGGDPLQFFYLPKISGAQILILEKQIKTCLQRGLGGLQPIFHKA